MNSKEANEKFKHLLPKNMAISITGEKDKQVIRILATYTNYSGQIKTISRLVNQLTEKAIKRQVGQCESYIRNTLKKEEELEKHTLVKELMNDIAPSDQTEITTTVSKIEPEEEPTIEKNEAVEIINDYIPSTIKELCNIDSSSFYAYNAGYINTNLFYGQLYLYQYQTRFDLEIHNIYKTMNDVIIAFNSGVISIPLYEPIFMNNEQSKCIIMINKEYSLILSEYNLSM